MIISRSIQKLYMKSHSLEIYLTMIVSTYSFLCVPTDPVTTTTSTAVQQQRQKEEQPQPPRINNQQFGKKRSRKFIIKLTTYDSTKKQSESTSINKLNKKGVPSIKLHSNSKDIPATWRGPHG